MSTHRTSSILRVLPNTMLPAKRLINAYDLAIQVDDEGLSGSIAECGVWSGGGIGLMALASMRANKSARTFHLFDSFEGLPPPSIEDADVLDSYRKKDPDRPLNSGEESSSLKAIGACVGIDAASVERFLTKTLRIPAERLTFHVGWFQQTVPAASGSIGPLAILRIDGDWYESTKICLDHLFDVVVDGGFIIVDDYGTFSGCRRAVDDFLENRGVSLNRLQHVDKDCVVFRKND